MSIATSTSPRPGPAPRPGRPPPSAARPEATCTATRATASTSPPRSPPSTDTPTCCCWPETSRATASPSRRRPSPTPAAGGAEQAGNLGDACRGRPFPIFAVLGNHDWHADRAAEVTAVLRDAGVTVLEREHVICRLGGAEVGIVGLKGFVGGFDGHRLPDFGEPQLRRLFADTAEDVDALDAGLRAIAHCPVRV